MIYPTRRQSCGLRDITVQGRVLHWRFFPKENNSILAVYGPESGRQPLRVRLRGWHESWCVHVGVPPTHITKVGPKFASEAILYGLANGWLPAQASAPLCVEYEAGQFSIGFEREESLGEGSGNMS